ncbi:MAG: DUF2490 domain-containing protein [Bacteroidetes bacterium]|nr:DUF2490 domain-containing protein [Bacteroidota bacterium]
MGEAKICCASLLFYYIIPLIVLIHSSIINLRAQQRDAGLWTSVNIEKKITQKFSAVASGELRFNDNISHLGTFFADPGITYAILKNFKIAYHYRFSNQRRLDGSYSKRHRYYFDFAYRHRLWKLSLQFRYRFQSQYTDILISEDGKIPEYTNRYKFTIRYLPDRPVKPYLAVEFFENFDGYYLSKIRYFLGLEYSLNKRNSVEIFYLIQKEVQTSDPLTDFIAGCSYAFTF